MTVLGFSQDLADRQLATILVDSAYIFDRSEASSGAGGQKVTFTKRPDAVACAIAPLGGGETSGRRTPRLDDRSTDVITMPSGTEVTPRDEIDVVGRGRFEVTVVRRRSVEIGREVEVMEAS